MCSAKPNEIRIIKNENKDSIEVKFERTDNAKQQNNKTNKIQIIIVFTVVIIEI